MDHEQTIHIYTQAVEAARREQQAPGAVVDHAVNFKLTVDLSKTQVYGVPEEVIQILEVDVERFVTSNIRTS